MEVVLDHNELAKNHSFMDLEFEPSPDHALLAVMTDTSGYEAYDIRVRDAKTGEFLSDFIPNTAGHVQWGADNSVLFYSTLDHAHRPHMLWRHQVGTDAKEDVCLYTEEDEKFWLRFYRSLSGEYLFIHPKSAVTSEVYFISARETLQSQPKLHLVKPRQQDVLYEVDHTSGRFWIVTNEGAKNFKLMYTPEDAPSRENWQTVMEHDPEVKIDGIECFRDYIGVFGRQKGLTAVWMIYLNTRAHRPLPGAKFRINPLTFNEEVYTVEAGINRVFDTQTVRLSYSSFVTPFTVYDYDIETGVLIQRKQIEVPNYDSKLYHSERLSATGSDGTKVPVSLVYRRDKHQKPGPVLLNGYGAYGISDDPEFDYRRLPLLDRGVVFATAHVRGGGELGRFWYEDGKYLRKKNTFTDFISAMEFLIKDGWTTRDKLVITGGSAGGLLMGAVINMRPDLCKAVFTRVPFVDIMGSMSDATVPLTVVEWEEWGNPNEEKFFEYMLSYSPYDQLKADADFPNIFVTTGLNDFRVAYWEPVKWVAKIRHVLSQREASSNKRTPLIMLKCKMDSGHAGSSGRYSHLEDKSLELAFILEQMGLAPAQLAPY
jgi:oligopeptidase B